MTTRILTTLATTFALTALAGAQASNFHLLKPYESKPGEIVLHQSTSDSQDGTVTVTQGSSQRAGSISIKSSGTMERRILGSGAKTKVQYRTISDLITTTTQYGETKNTESRSGPLLGKTVSGFRDDSGKWRLFLEEGVADAKVSADISELEAYENRRWFLAQPVKIGQSWPIDPAFIRHLTERDLGEAEIKATMTFKSIETIDDEPTAILTFKIETLGLNVDSENKTSAGAKTSLAGLVQISLATMLDKRIKMTGTLATMARRDGVTTMVTLPINMAVSKTVRPQAP